MTGARIHSRLLMEWLFVSVLAIGTVVMGSATGLVTRADNLLYDSLVRFSPPSRAPQVTIVAIDSESLAEIGAWPWPRSTHAAAIRRLAAAKPAAIGYDVLFVEPREGDAEVAAAMAEAGQVLLPLAFDVPGADGAPFTPELPVSVIRKAARGVGEAIVSFDDDGVVRRASLVAGSGAERWPHLAELLYRAAFETGSPASGRNAAGAALPPGRFTAAAPALIRFGPLGRRFPTVSFRAVLAGEVAPELLRGRILLVGNTAPGSGDQYPVPASGGTAAMPGVEILGNVVEGLIGDDLIRPAGRVAIAAFTLLPLTILLVSLLRLPPRLNLLIGALLMLAMVLTSAVLLRFGNLWLPPSGGLIALAIVYPFWAWRRLAATSAFMSRELKELGLEPDEMPGTSIASHDDRIFGDAVAEQTDLLERAIGRVRDLRRFFSDSLQSLPDPTLVLDHDGRVLVANQAAHDLFGVESGLGGTPAPDLARLLDGLSSDAADFTLAPVEGREIVARNGRILTLGIAPLASAQSQRVGWIARLSDITAIRLATRQREEALQLLTHDMRSPQASILALLDQGAEDPATRARIAAYARRTLGLADAYVQLARAEAADYRQEVLDFASLMIEAADDQWTLANRRRIAITTEQEAEEYLVRGDHALLVRALVNVINNAVKHSPDGGAVQCTLRREGAAIVCRIADQGRGIPADMLDQVFERFRTSDQKDGLGGAGLGLAFVRTVFERHGGSVACENRAEGGALFRLSLPPADGAEGE